MKILVIGRTIPDKKDATAGLFELEQAKGLHERGHDVVYGFVDNRSIKKNIKVKSTNKSLNGMRVIGYHLPIGGIPKRIFDSIKYSLFKKLYKLVLRNYGKPQVIHVHFPLITLNTRIIEFIRENDIKLVATEHWSKVVKMGLSPREEQILKSLFMTASEIIAVSEELAGALKEYNRRMGKIYKRDIKVIYNLLNTVYHYVPKRDNNYFSFASIGRLEPIKGNEIVIKAFIELKKQIQNIRLYIIGDGSERKNLELLAKEAGIHEDINFTGFLSSENIMNLFKDIDVFISGSMLETFGVPVIESWMMGRPVIIADNHPLVGFVNKSNGAIFESNHEGSVESLTKKMREVYEMTYDHRNISNECEDIFSRDKVLAQIEQVYKIDSI